MKKAINVIIISMVIICSLGIVASATNSSQVSFTGNDIDTVFDVSNYRFTHDFDDDGEEETAFTTNIGGISVGAANNRLFVVKSHNGEEFGSLYYYNNINNPAFANGTKLPKRILFKNGLLGHANAMAIDNSYIYVTMWQKNSAGEKNKILQISRKAIGLLNDNAEITSTNQTVTDSQGNNVIICTEYDPVKDTGGSYNSSIYAITTYSYNSTAHRTRFLINYPAKTTSTKLGYTIATLYNGVFTVSTSVDDTFTVDKTYTDVSMQDIFYDSHYGMFIPMRESNSNTNHILRVDISQLSTQGKTSSLNFTPIQYIDITKNSDQNGTLQTFEIESIAFIKRDEDLENLGPANYRLIYSCNKEAKNKGHDAIEEITTFNSQILPL